MTHSNRPSCLLYELNLDLEDYEILVPVLSIHLLILWYFYLYDPRGVLSKRLSMSTSGRVRDCGVGRNTLYRFDDMVEILHDHAFSIAGYNFVATIVF